MSFIPDGESGNWKVSTFIVPENDFSQGLSALNSGRSVPAGTYKSLTRGGKVIMSNTPDEIRDFYHFVNRAHGSVLINGLGLGCVVKALLEKQGISKVTVIEQSQDVISLVAPHFGDPRLVIVHANAFDYSPPKGEIFQFVWHDIWDDICSDNLKEMATLHRKYGKRAGYQDSWAKGLCQRQKRQSSHVFRF